MIRQFTDLLIQGVQPKTRVTIILLITQAHKNVVDLVMLLIQ